MGIKLDQIDYKLLDLLSNDSRSSYAELGRLINLSRVSVRDRVNKLIENGVIERFSIIINPKMVGFNLSVFFEIDVHPHKLQEVAKSLAENKHVLSVNQMTGPSTLHAHAALKDNHHLQSFLVNSVYSLPGINAVNSFVLLRGFKSKSGGIKIGI